MAVTMTWTKEPHYLVLSPCQAEEQDRGLQTIYLVSYFTWYLLDLQMKVRNDFSIKEKTIAPRQPTMGCCLLSIVSE